MGRLHELCGMVDGAAGDINEIRKSNWTSEMKVNHTTHHARHLWLAAAAEAAAPTSAYKLNVVEQMNSNWTLNSGEFALQANQELRSSCVLNKPHIARKFVVLLA